MRERIYILQGDPIDWGHPNVNVPGQPFQNESSNRNKLIMTIGLQSAHNDEPPFKGAVSFEAIFNMRLPWRAARGCVADSYCIGGPPLINLMQFIYECAMRSGIITNKNQIVKTSCSKIYSNTSGLYLKVSQ